MTVNPFSIKRKWSVEIGQSYLVKTGIIDVTCEKGIHSDQFARSGLPGFSLDRSNSFPVRKEICGRCSYKNTQTDISPVFTNAER